jgi:hypothetical protein
VPFVKYLDATPLPASHCLHPLAAGSWIEFTNFIYTAPATIGDSSAIAGGHKFFRAVTP